MVSVLRVSWCAFSTVPVRVRLQSGISGADFTGATGGTIQIRRPDGQVVKTLAAAIDGTPTAAEAALLHVLVPGDLEDLGLGAYQLVGLVEVPGVGTVPSQPQDVTLAP